MKTIFKTLFIGALAFLCSTSCKKQDNEPKLTNVVLENNEVFRNYVATDLLSRVRISLLSVKQLKGTGYVNFKKELQASDESAISGVFQTHGMDYSLFQKHVFSRVVRRARIIQKFMPLFERLPDDVVDTRINEAYNKVSNDILERAHDQFLQRAKAEKQLNPILTIASTSVNPLISQKKSVNSIDELLDDYYLLYDFETDLPTNLVVDDISVELDKANSDGLTISETWNCFKNALGFGGLGMSGIAGWARLSAGLQIQELITVASKWALKHIGWIGAAIAIADFSICIYDSI